VNVFSVNQPLFAASFEYSNSQDSFDKTCSESLKDSRHFNHNFLLLELLELEEEEEIKEQESQIDGDNTSFPFSWSLVELAKHRDAYTHTFLEFKNNLQLRHFFAVFERICVYRL
jgi:hypothetical protein